MTADTSPILGLDWDGTISCHAAALAILAKLARRVVIINVNDEIDVALAASTLDLPSERIELIVCPDARLEDYPTWKAEMCLRESVDLMIDDDAFVADACRRVGIPVLRVRDESCFGRVGQRNAHAAAPSAAEKGGGNSGRSSSKRP